MGRLRRGRDWARARQARLEARVAEGLAWRVAPRRERRNPRLVLGLVAGVVLTVGASAAAELNATLWERRAQRLRLNTPPP